MLSRNKVSEAEAFDKFKLYKYSLSLFLCNNLEILSLVIYTYFYFVFLIMIECRNLSFTFFISTFYYV